LLCTTISLPEEGGHTPRYIQGLPPANQSQGSPYSSTRILVENVLDVRDDPVNDTSDRSILWI